MPTAVCAWQLLGPRRLAHLRVRDIEAGKVTIDPIPESEGVSYGYGFVPSSAEFSQSQSVSPVSVTEEAGLKAVNDTNVE